MGGRGFATLTVLLTGLLLVRTPASVPTVTAAPQTMPKLVNIAALSPGSTLTIFANGISKVMGDHTKMVPKVQNFSTYVTYMPMVNEGDIEMGATISTEALYAWKGIAPYKKSPNIRLLIAGPDILTAYMATKASGIRTIRDLKGKRVSLVVTIPTMKLWGEASLKAAGLDPAKDIVVVPASDPNEAVEALMDKRAEVVQSAPPMPLAREADAKLRGIYFLPAVTSDLEKRELLKILPGYRITTIKANAYPGVPENLPTLARPIYMIVSKDLPAQAAYEVVKAVWERHSDLLPIHPMFRGWPPQEMVAADATVPYHEGAIRYFKERGAWTPEMEKIQQQLSKQ